MRGLKASISVCAALGALLAAGDAAADAVFLRSGEIISGRITAADEDSVTLSGKTEVPRHKISEIRFIKPPKPKPKGRKDKTDTEAARAEELFAQAEKFGKKYPGAEGLILRNDGEFEYRANGTWVTRTRFAGQILNPSLIEQWRALAEGLDDGRERVRILRASVYCPGGENYPFDARNMKVSNTQADDLFFFDSKMLTYTFPRLAQGCIVETEVERDTYNPFRKDFFFPAWVFASSQPTLEASLEIKVPPGKKLFYSTAGFEQAQAAEPVIKTGTDGTASYRWQLSDMAPITSEPEMPNPMELSPRLKASLFKDWTPVSDWLSAMHTERLSLSPEMKAFADKLTAKAATPEEKTALFYHWIQRNIRYVAVKLGVSSNWGGYSAKKTWTKRYGCCIDKSLLLCAFLRYYGIECSPVVLDVNESPAHDMALPDIEFEHAITWVKLPSGEIYLDATGYDHRFPTMPAPDYGVYALNVLQNKVVFIPPPAPEANASTYRYSVSISTTGRADVSLTTSYNGPREGELRGMYKGMDEEYRTRAVAQWISETSPGARVKTFSLANEEDISKPFTLTLTYSAEHYLSEAGDIALLTVPDLLMTFPETSLRERRHPIKYSIPSLRDFAYDINLPPGYEPVSLPEPVTMAGPYADFSLHWAYADGKLKCEGRFSRKAMRVPPDDYAAYREFLSAVTRETDRRIFLRIK